MKDPWELNNRGQFAEWPVSEMLLVGARFRNGRRQAGLSQRRVARRAGVSQSAVSRLERGLSTSMAAHRMIRIAAAIGPYFPFGFCPHMDHRCAYPYNPDARRNVLDMLG